MLRTTTPRLFAALVLVVGVASVAWASGGRETAPDPAAAAPLRLEAGYMPILPDSQLFVIAGNHWARKEGIDLKLVEFSDGPAMVQAAASGRLDVMYFGIGPAMVAYARGVKLRVVASNDVRPIAFIARRDLWRYYSSSDPAATFARFEHARGRRARIATFPEGSVPYTVLRYWLTRRLGLAMDSVTVLGMGASRVQEALLAGKVDGAATLEPILTIVEQRDPTARVLARANEMFPGQPGAVLAVRDRLIEQHPGAVRKLVELQIRAIRYLRSDLPQAADLVTRFVGQGLVSRSIIAKALRSPSTHLLVDPTKIVEPTQKMLDFQVRTGSIAKKVDLSALFDSSFYLQSVK